MKHTFLIDQRIMEAAELKLNRYLVLDLILNSSSWADEIIHEGKTYWWLARQKTCDEIKVICSGIKTDTVYRIYCELEKMELVEYVKDGVKDLLRPTDKAKALFRTMSDVDPNTMSDVDPNELGYRSESYSDTDPTYTSTNVNTSTKDKYIYTRVAQEFRKLGGSACVQAEQAFKIKVAAAGREIEFAIGAQNYLNAKLNARQTYIHSLYKFIRDEHWCGHDLETVLPGPIHIDGAPPPVSDDIERRADVFVTVIKRWLTDEGKRWQRWLEYFQDVSEEKLKEYYVERKLSYSADQIGRMIDANIDDGLHNPKDRKYLTYAIEMAVVKLDNARGAA